MVEPFQHHTTDILIVGAGPAGRRVGGRVGRKQGFGARGDRLGVDRVQGTRTFTHDNSPANRSFNTTLARKSLFLTVPRGMFFNRAISS